MEEYRTEQVEDWREMNKLDKGDRCKEPALFPHNSMQKCNKVALGNELFHLLPVLKKKKSQ